MDYRLWTVAPYCGLWTIDYYTGERGGENPQIGTGNFYWSATLSIIVAPSVNGVWCIVYGE